MKNPKLFIILILTAVLMAACNMVPWEDIVSLNVTPSLIKKVPKTYPGGNADCSNINITGLVQTTGRNNYDPSTDQFDYAWPSGLLVKVYDDKSVSFQIDGNINLGDGKCYKVGAVIVKGSDASNVYNYTDMGGVAMDAGLVPPINASGSPAGLSNLTFCFMECEEKEPVVIAVKSWYWKSYDSFVNQIWSDHDFGLSLGAKVFNTGDWCDVLGINYFPGTNSFPLSGNIGSVTIQEAWPVGIHSLIITVDLADGLVLDNTSLYVGNLIGLTNAPLSPTGCPQYGNWPYQMNTKVNTHVFTVPY